VFDLALGEKVVSVFGGPADREAFGEHEEFIAKRIPQIKYSEKQKIQQKYFQLVRKIRSQNLEQRHLIEQIEKVFNEYILNENQDWLLLLECYELVLNRTGESEWQKKLRSELEKRASQNPLIKPLIEVGLRLSSIT
jgi:phenylalanine-4-hydroxylase